MSPQNALQYRLPVHRQFHRGANILVVIRLGVHKHGERVMHVARDLSDDYSFTFCEKMQSLQRRRIDVINRIRFQRRHARAAVLDIQGLHSIKVRFAFLEVVRVAFCLSANTGIPVDQRVGAGANSLCPLFVTKPIRTNGKMIIGHDKREVRVCRGKRKGHGMFAVGLDVHDLRHQSFTGRLGVLAPMHGE